VTSDILCTNGVIHVIDQVLLPPDMMAAGNASAPGGMPANGPGAPNGPANGSPAPMPAGQNMPC
jgi:hypothetical protein